MNYLTKWQDDVLSRSSLSVRSSVRVQGLRNEHLGPMLECAAIDVIAEPADSFDVQVGADMRISDDNQLYLEAAVYGLLDILLVSEPYPIRNIRITIMQLECDPISSSQMAFRHAGRDAGRKIIAALKSLPATPGTTATAW